MRKRDFHLRKRAFMGREVQLIKRLRVGKGWIGPLRSKLHLLLVLQRGVEKMVLRG
jgi:hypothetical protein